MQICTNRAPAPGFKGVAFVSYHWLREGGPRAVGLPPAPASNLGKLLKWLRADAEGAFIAFDEVRGSSLGGLGRPIRRQNKPTN